MMVLNMSQKNIELGVNMEQETILGYDKDRNPIYPNKKGNITTQAFIICDYCAKAIKTTGGPRFGSICVECYKEETNENKH